jgi:hypothetical protein
MEFVDLIVGGALLLVCGSILIGKAWKAVWTDQPMVTIKVAAPGLRRDRKRVA